MGQGIDGAKFMTFTVDEQTASWFSGYFAVILKSVTVDGWVVIGILMIMAVISWTVMVDRARYLGTQAKANARFLAAFRDIGGDLSSLDSAGDEAIATLDGRLAGPVQRLIGQSSLYRLYELARARDPRPLLRASRSARPRPDRSRRRLDPRRPRRGRWSARSRNSTARWSC